MEVIDIMKDQSFVLYREKYVFLGGKISDGCLELHSSVDMGDFDSERFYSFTKEETDKLFSVISLEEFKKLCRDGNLTGLEAFLGENGIMYNSFTI